MERFTQTPSPEGQNHKMQTILRSALDNFHRARITTNPSNLLYTYKGIGGRDYGRIFSGYFDHGGIIGGDRRGDSKIFKTEPWKSFLWWQARDYAGDLNSGNSMNKFCFAVMDKFKVKKRPGAAKDDRSGRKMIPWKNVPVIFMTPSYFESVRINCDPGPNQLSWEDFCKKVTIVNSESEFLREFDRFLLLHRVNHNIPDEKSNNN